MQEIILQRKKVSITLEGFRKRHLHFWHSQRRQKN